MDPRQDSLLDSLGIPALRECKWSPCGFIPGWSFFTVYRVWAQIFCNYGLLYKNIKRELLMNVWRMIYLLWNIAKIAILEICWYFSEMMNQCYSIFVAGSSLCWLGKAWLVLPALNTQIQKIILEFCNSRGQSLRHNLSMSWNFALLK